MIRMPLRRSETRRRRLGRRGDTRQPRQHLISRRHPPHRLADPPVLPRPQQIRLDPELSQHLAQQHVKRQLSARISDLMPRLGPLESPRQPLASAARSHTPPGQETRPAPARGTPPPSGPPHDHQRQEEGPAPHAAYRQPCGRSRRPAHAAPRGAPRHPRRHATAPLHALADESDYPHTARDWKKQLLPIVAKPGPRRIHRRAIFRKRAETDSTAIPGNAEPNGTAGEITNTRGGLAVPRIVPFV
jgi:hypothetical protein